MGKESRSPPLLPTPPQQEEDMGRIEEIIFIILFLGCLYTAGAIIYVLFGLYF
jgi:hypothetical protein